VQVFGVRVGMNVGTIEVDAVGVDIVHAESQRYGPWLWSAEEDKGRRERKERRARNRTVRGPQIWRSWRVERSEARLCRELRAA